MLDVPEFERWQQAADDALTGARTQREARSAHWACFLAEQASQLSIKGLLHAVGAPAWGHDLVDLGDRLAVEFDRELPSDLADSLRRLSRHYIPTRYPDAHPSGTPGGHYGTTDADEAITDAQRVLTTVVDVFEQLRVAARSIDDDGHAS